MTPEQTAEQLVDAIFLSGAQWGQHDWSFAKARIAQAIRDAENAAEERCYAASEELCAKIAEMHDELQHLRSLKSQEN